MNQQQLFALISRLHRQKYPLPIIAIIVLVSLVFSQWQWLSPSQKAPPQKADECEVLKVYDGDTMTLQCPQQTEKTKVRLYCIDTPEKKQTPWGDQARDHLRSLATKHVRLVKVDQDRYGRIVGEVYAGDLNLNLAQVEAGQAAVYDAYCKDPKYKVAEDKAKSAKKGIWSVSGLQQTPWKWRRTH